MRDPVAVVVVVESAVEVTDRVELLPRLRLDTRSGWFPSDRSAFSFSCSRRSDEAWNEIKILIPIHVRLERI